jgi:hypothetical protein
MTAGADDLLKRVHRETVCERRDELSWVSWAEAVALGAMPISQNRDMGHPIMWQNKCRA